MVDDPHPSLHTTTGSLAAAGLDEEAVKEWLYAFARHSLDYSILLVATDKRILWANPGAGWLLAATTAEIVGRSVSDFFTPEDRAFGIPDHEQRSALRQGSSDDDRWMLRADDSRFWASGKTVALSQRDGTPIGFLKIFRDRTETKMRLEALQRQHDPVHNPPAPTAAVDRPVSRPDAVASVKFEPLLLHDVLQAAISTAEERAAERRNVQLLLPHGAPLVIEGDRECLVQAFALLVENAFRSTPGDGSIWVNGAPAGRLAVVHVEDNGRGMTPDELAAVFALFIQPRGQAPAGQSSQGLNRVKQLIELHGGAVQAQSAGANKGSEFIVRLPLQQPARAGHG